MFKILENFEKIEINFKESLEKQFEKFDKILEKSFNIRRKNLKNI